MILVALQFWCLPLVYILDWVWIFHVAIGRKSRRTVYAGLSPVIAQGVCLCCKSALVTLCVFNVPIWNKLFLMRRLVDFTATSLLLLLFRLYAEVTRSSFSYRSKKSWTIVTSNTLAPSYLKVRGIPKIEKQSHQVLSNSSLVSLFS